MCGHVCRCAVMCCAVMSLGLADTYIMLVSVQHPPHVSLVLCKGAVVLCKSAVDRRR